MTRYMQMKCEMLARMTALASLAFGLAGQMRKRGINDA